MTGRLKQLIDYYDEDPSDPLNLYLLALEYKKSDVLKSRELFNLLLEQHPDYLPGYYTAAELLYSLGETESAVSILEKGFGLAMKSGSSKAASEIQNLINEITAE